MADDRSLDEFLGEGSDSEGDADADGGEPDEEPSDRSDHDEAADERDDAPEPAVSTTAFDPDGAPCEACDESVRRRWRDDGALVCSDCKAW